ncbi:hypothetical protein EIP86_001889 [Pleurotus ostreatoroseus]|nr:hypothetical protein EIP86_001889 [Pleurotus ostreatoroseus]
MTQPSPALSDMAQDLHGHPVPPAPPPSPSPVPIPGGRSASAEDAPDAPAPGPGFVADADPALAAPADNALPGLDPPAYTPAFLRPRVLTLAAVAALVSTPMVELPTYDCIPLRVESRAGELGSSAKVEWGLYEHPRQPIRTGMRIALCTPRGQYRGIARTVGPLVGFDRHWVTFILSPGRSLPATVQTISVPVANATIPLFARILRFLFASYLPDEHPRDYLPLPQFRPLALF